MRRLMFFLIVGLIGTAIPVGLGKWQLDRLEWKQALLAEINDRIDGEPIELPANPDPVNDKYQPVTVAGEFTGDYIRVLASIKEIGAVQRIVAVVQTDGRKIMVDIGWISALNEPKISLSGPVRVTGNLHWPNEIDSYTPDPDLAKNQWFARDVTAMAEQLKTEPILVVAKTLAPLPADVTPLPVDTAGIPNDHLNYAITWFSLASVWAAMSGLLYWRTRQKREL